MTKEEENRLKILPYRQGSSGFWEKSWTLKKLQEDFLSIGQNNIGVKLRPRHDSEG